MGEVVTIGTKKAEFVSGIGKLFNEVAEGEFTGLVVVALHRDGSISRMCGGNVRDDLLALIGALEVSKAWAIEELKKV